MAGRRFRVVVAGAGVSGLFMTETLKRARIDFAVYEKADEVGGTWRDNTFPGLFVDVLSRQYEFPFQPNYDWSRKYAPATEIWAYIKKVAGDRGLTKFIRFNEEIVAARFTDGCWHLETARGNFDVADVFVCATGFLHKPLFPDIAGRESFAGSSFHSSRWDHTVPYAGKRWGSSAAVRAVCRSPRRWPGPAATSLSSSAARSGSISARTSTRPGWSA
jgi:cation diffusion facilitator CzcD-associated flavoprotein CzcO